MGWTFVIKPNLYVILNRISFASSVVILKQQKVSLELLDSTTLHYTNLFYFAICVGGGGGGGGDFTFDKLGLACMVINI